MKDAFFVLTEGEISSVIDKIKETAEKEKFRRLEKKYASACHQMGSINNAEEARNIRNLFKQLGDYKDSPQKAKELLLLERDLKKKQF